MIARLLRRIGTLIRYLTTARDNQTPSLIRIIAIGTGTQFLFLAHWSIVMNKQDFDPQAYCTGVGLLLVALAAALRVALPANSGNDVPVQEGAEK